MAKKELDLEIAKSNCYHQGVSNTTRLQRIDSRLILKHALVHCKIHHAKLSTSET